MLNTPEIIALLVLALILFGAKKLPELAKGLGHGIKEFRKASREISDELNTAIHEEPPSGSRRSPSSYSPPPQPEGTQPRTEGMGTDSGPPSDATAAGGQSEDQSPVRPA
jgi:sec-independent protein translocase protein TatA